MLTSEDYKQLAERCVELPASVLRRPWPKRGERLQ
jgi:hypothetical protein